MPASPGGWRWSISCRRRREPAPPRQLALPLALVCFAMGVLRVTQALRMLVLRASLVDGASRSSAPVTWLDGAGSGLGVPGLRFRMAARCIRSGSMNSPRSTTGVRRVAAPAAALGLRQQAPAGRRDRSALHPRRRTEGRPLHRPLQNFEGGTLLVRTTQSGKGVALANLITQAIRRGDVVIVIDRRTAGA